MTQAMASSARTARARPVRAPAVRVRCLLPLLFALATFLPACGGGGGGGGAGTAVTPPTSLTYGDNTPLYRTDGAVVPNNPITTGGAPTAYSVVPALPTGLAIHPGTGVISGIPVAPAAPAAYIVTAANGGGSVDAVVNLEVQWVDFKSIAPMGALTDADIRFFLERTHFGFHQAQYDDINTSGMGTFLDGALAAINSGATPTLETAADTLVVDAAFPSEAELATWWLHCIQGTPNPLQESLALHWHEHFSCSSEVLPDEATFWYFDHIDLWRYNAAGNLRDLILAMSRDRSMLEYLDGRDSTKNAPNENFGREFMELFLFGVNNGYTQSDIVAAAALFSGYRRAFDGTHHQIQWQPGQHNDDDQTYLGVSFTGVTNPPADIYDQVVDTALAHKPVGDSIGYASRWLVRSLLRRYCYDNPAQELIDQLATQLEAGNWELTPLLKTIFRSEAFYSQMSRAGFVKSPIEHLLGFIHTTGLRMPVERNATYLTFGLDSLLSGLGNRATQPPVVDGWPEGQSWLSAQGMVDRANVIKEIISHRTYHTDQGIDPATLLPNPATAQDVVTAMALRFQITLSVGESQALVDYLNTDDTGSTVADPWSPVNVTHIDNRFRGLLYILAQHPQYLLR